MTEMTLEERILRLEAYLGIGDSLEAEKTRALAKKRDEESKRQSDLLQAMMLPFSSSSKAFLENHRQK